MLKELLCIYSPV